MKKILNRLYKYKKSTPATVREMKEQLEREEKEQCIELYKQGVRGSAVVPDKVTEIDAVVCKFYAETESQKKLIFYLELEDEYFDFLDQIEKLENSFDRFTDRLIMRNNISLTEIIIGHFLPKGDMDLRCEQFEGYKEAKKEADKLHASYSRTLKRMTEQGLIEKIEGKYKRIVEKFEKRYKITDFGETIQLNVKC